ncbi:MAG: 23S rRNA (adenine(1618)-N(6))-methyltransferase RlmF [Bacteroidetes bacterium]|nr:23S rRNA (adenine(1618)-N(6))-methyltransferase RlmF [Bacteroidota bacterium]
MQKKRVHPKDKVELHGRNKHRKRYNFKLLCESCLELIPFVKLNDYNDESIDFFNAEAVKMLNTALLKHFYGIKYWSIPQNYLCPPIPGRADYVHYVADLLGSSFNNEIPKGDKIKCLDIGVGANCVYPIIGNSEYGWSFVGADIDSLAIESAAKIVELNPTLKGDVELRVQQNSKNIFNGIIREKERFDATLCNPPFHASAADAQSGALRKLKNLKQKNVKNASLNFGGQNNELWCEGGEERFVTDMIFQSKQFATSCLWFTTLISKQSNLNGVYKALKSVGAADVKTIPMGQGNKISRLVAWTFLTSAQQKMWTELDCKCIPEKEQN